MKADFLAKEVEELKKNSLDWKIRFLESPSKPHAIVDGKEVLMLNTNNYLGLATHPRIIKAAQEAIEKYGFGAGAVPVISGTFDLTKQFEENFAKFKEVEASLLCQTGFAVNSGVIPQLLTPQSLVISDELNHGSIIDGVRLSKAERRIYKHCDMSSLEEQLKDSDKFDRTLILTDGVFSMDGDLTPLDKITSLAEEHNALVFVDDCHGEGVLGEGRGIVHHFKLQGRVDVEGGSMSKGFGVFGGTIAGSKDLIEFSLNKSRTYLLSTAHPPAVVAACNEAIRIVESEPEHVENVWKHTEYFKKQLISLGFNTGNSATPIIPIITGDAEKAQTLSDQLYKEENIFATPIVYPMVAKELSRIRTQMNALLTKEDLDKALSALERIGKKLKII